MDKYGKRLSLIPLSAEIYLAWHNVQIYLERKATYAGMSLDSIFQTSRDSLIQMIERTQTPYILANTYVYILPMVIQNKRLWQPFSSVGSTSRQSSFGGK